MIIIEIEILEAHGVKGLAINAVKECWTGSSAGATDTLLAEARDRGLFTPEQQRVVDSLVDNGLVLLTWNNDHDLVIRQEG